MSEIASGMRELRVRDETAAMLRRELMLFSLLMLLAELLFAQGWWDSKPYTAWSKDDVQNILDKSPWGIVQKKTIETVGHFRNGVLGNSQRTSSISHSWI
jgi:hypothetical protein